MKCVACLLKRNTNMLSRKGEQTAPHSTNATENHPLSHRRATTREHWGKIYMPAARESVAKEVVGVGIRLKRIVIDRAGFLGEQKHLTLPPSPWCKSLVAKAGTSSMDVSYPVPFQKP